MLNSHLDNLVYKSFLKKATFGEISDILNDQGCNWRTIRNFILDIKDEEIKERLINEAKENYASKFLCNPKEVLFGDYVEAYVSDQVETFPYSCVIGNVVISKSCKDMSKLIVVRGDLSSYGVKDFPNLERVFGSADFDTSGEKRTRIQLPKMHRCGALCLNNVIAEELIISFANDVYINNSKIGYLRVRNPVKLLKVTPNSIINYLSIPSIEELNCYEREDGVKFKYINPETEIVKITPEPDYSVGLRIQQIRKEIENGKEREIIKRIELNLKQKNC